MLPVPVGQKGVFARRRGHGPLDQPHDENAIEFHPSRSAEGAGEDTFAETANPSAGGLEGLFNHLLEQVNGLARGPRDRRRQLPFSCRIP